MDLLRENAKKLYLRYLAAAFGSSMISTVYSLVDMIVVGQDQGPDGTAALAVVAPVWNIIYGLGSNHAVSCSHHQNIYVSHTGGH